MSDCLCVRPPLTKSGKQHFTSSKLRPSSVHELGGVKIAQHPMTLNSRIFPGLLMIPLLKWRNITPIHQMECDTVCHTTY